MIFFFPFRRRLYFPQNVSHARITVSSEHTRPIMTTTTTSNDEKKKATSSSSTTTRYDRQMRLWGERGQQLLHQSKILVLDSGPTSAEMAKNLILGGICALTMCDSGARRVQERDLGNNFMTSVVVGAGAGAGARGGGGGDEASLASFPSSSAASSNLEWTKKVKRGEMVCEHLRLLNRNVRVDFWEEDPREMIERFRLDEKEMKMKMKDNNEEEEEDDDDKKGKESSHRLQDFDIILASQLDEPTMIKLDEICRKLGKRLVTTRSHGCFGTVKISGAKTHCVVEAKPENRKMDLRLSESGVFKELEEFAEKFEDLEAMDEQRFAHVPWAVLLLVAKKRFEGTAKLEQGDYEAQKQFKEFLKSMRRTKTELNFEEALENVRVVWQKAEVPENVLECFKKLPREFRGSSAEEGDGVAIMDIETTMTTTTTTTTSYSSADVVSIADVGVSDVSTKLFWIFVAALEEFTKRNKNFLPLDAGALPDMTSTTDAFVGLQRVYLAKAQKDQCEMLRIVKETIVPNLKKTTTTSKDNNNSSSNSRHTNKVVEVIEKGVDEKQLEEFCAKFCKNARDIRFVSFTSLADERDIWRWENKPGFERKKAQVASFLAVDSPQRVCAYSYALLRASDAFEAKLCRKAGTYAPAEGVVASSGTEKGKSMLFHRMTSDCAELRALVTKDLEAAMFQSSSASTSPTTMDTGGADGAKQAAGEEAGKFLEQLAWEVVRSQGGEIHAIASVVGGIASQEAIKLITEQFVPSHGRVCVHLADGSSAVLP